MNVDILETRVKESHTNQGKTEFVLDAEGHEPIKFNLPLLVNLEPGDRIKFEEARLGKVGITIKDNQINHQDYTKAYMFTGPREDKPVLIVSAYDMQDLEQVQVCRACKSKDS